MKHIWSIYYHVCPQIYYSCLISYPKIKISIICIFTFRLLSRDLCTSGCTNPMNKCTRETSTSLTLRRGRQTQSECSLIVAHTMGTLCDSCCDFMLWYMHHASWLWRVMYMYQYEHTGTWISMVKRVQSSEQKTFFNMIDLIYIFGGLGWSGRYLWQTKSDNSFFVQWLMSLCLYRDYFCQL